jgi:parvulin-like peptidyl-prolyl isomerase
LAKKKKLEKPKREVTKRQLSQWQRQKRRQRLFLILGISVIAAVAGIMGRGWYIGQYLPMHEVVIRVNDTEFNMGYYIKMLELSGGNQPQYLPYLADQVVTAIEQNELIRDGAEGLGITATNSEVDEMLKKFNPPLSKDYRDLVRAEILKSKVRDVYCDPLVPTVAEQRHIMAMFLESESQANEVRDRLKGGEDFGELAGELSLDSLTQTQKGDLGWHPSGILSETMGTSIPDDYGFTLSVGALSQPLYDEAKTKSVGYWLVKVVDKNEEEQKFQLQVMLLGSEQEAQEVIIRLENGEDFATVAKELSQDSASKDKGGDLGSVTADGINSVYKDFVINAEPGTLSQPIKDTTVTTKGGYWLVKVLEKEDNRQIEDSDRDILKDNVLNDWVSSLWDNPDNKVESYLDNDKMMWAVDQATKLITKQGGLSQ